MSGEGSDGVPPAPPLEPLAPMNGSSNRPSGMPEGFKAALEQKATAAAAANRAAAAEIATKKALARRTQTTEANLPKMRNMPEWAKQMLIESREESEDRQKAREQKKVRIRQEREAKLRSVDDFWNRVTSIRHMAGGLDSYGAWRFTAPGNGTATTSTTTPSTASTATTTATTTTTTTATANSSSAFSACSSSACSSSSSSSASSSAVSQETAKPSNSRTPSSADLKEAAEPRSPQGAPKLQAQLSERLATGLTMVAKGVASDSSIEESFADTLYRGAGIRTPAGLRVVGPSDPEFERIKCSAYVNAPDDEVAWKLSTLLTPGVIHIMGFVIGRGWYDGYTPDSGWGSRPTPVLEPGLLRSLGRILSMDMLVNNYDRLPLGDVWMNEGNMGNLLFDDQGVVAIDQAIHSICPISQPAGFTTYFKAVQVVVQQLRTQALPECVLSFQKWVRTNHYEMRDADRDALKAGLLEGVEYIRTTLTAATIASLIRTAKKAYTDRGLDASYLNEDFLLRMLPAFA